MQRHQSWILSSNFEPSNLPFLNIASNLPFLNLANNLSTQSPNFPIHQQKPLHPFPFHGLHPSPIRNHTASHIKLPLVQQIFALPKHRIKLDELGNYSKQVAGINPIKLNGAFQSVRQEEVRVLLEQIMKLSSCNDSGMRKVDLKTKFTELSFNEMTMVMVGRRFYGEDVVDQVEAKNLREVIRDGVELSIATNLGDFLPFMQWMDITGLKKKMVGLSVRMDKFLQGLLEESRKIMATDYDGKDRVRKLMIDNLLSLQETEQKYFSEREEVNLRTPKPCV